MSTHAYFCISWLFLIPSFNVLSNYFNLVVVPTNSARRARGGMNNTAQRKTLRTTESHDWCSELLGMRMPKDRWPLALKTLLVVNSFKLHLNAFITLPYALWNLTLTKKLLVNDKSQLLVQTLYFPSIISNFANKKLQLQSVLIYLKFVHPCLLLYQLTVFNTLF